MLRIVLAMLVGGVIGLERERKGRAAGFRTYMLVAVGAAVTVGNAGNTGTKPAPAAVIATASRLCVLTKAPIRSTTVVLISSTETEEMVGTTVLGTFSVSVQVLVPVREPPL